MADWGEPVGGGKKKKKKKRRNQHNDNRGMNAAWLITDQAYTPPPPTHDDPPRSMNLIGTINPIRRTPLQHCVASYRFALNRVIETVHTDFVQDFDWDDVETAILITEDSSVPCIICLSDSVCPRVLPCGHTPGCAACLIRWFRVSSYACPICNELCRLIDMKRLLLCEKQKDATKFRAVRHTNTSYLWGMDADYLYNPFCLLNEESFETLKKNDVEAIQEKIKSLANDDEEVENVAIWNDLLQSISLEMYTENNHNPDVESSDKNNDTTVLYQCVDGSSRFVDSFTLKLLKQGDEDLPPFIEGETLFSFKFEQGFKSRYSWLQVPQFTNVTMCMPDIRSLLQSNKITAFEAEMRKRQKKKVAAEKEREKRERRARAAAPVSTQRRYHMFSPEDPAPSAQDFDVDSGVDVNDEVSLDGLRSVKTQGSIFLSYAAVARE